MSQVHHTPFFTLCLGTCHSFHFQTPPTLPPPPNLVSIWCNPYILRSRSKVKDHGLCEDLCPDLYYITLKQSHAFYFFVLWDLREHKQRFILFLIWEQWYLKINLLRYNFHTKICTYLKHTIQGVSPMHMPCEINSMNLDTDLFNHSPKFPPVPF